MNGDIEDLLREGMERFTADLRAPAGLTRRAGPRRGRRLALCSAAGAAAALAAAAVAVAVAGVPVALGNSTGVSAVPDAYVVKRVDSALNAAEPTAIAHMTVTTRGARVPGGTIARTIAEEWSYGGRWRSVVSSPAGPVYDEGSSASPVYTVVDYQTRTWARQSGLGRPEEPAPGSHGCAAIPLLLWPGLPGIGSAPGSLPATVAATLRTAVSCGTLAVAGRQRVDGTEAIELTNRPGAQISETIWVSPGTYLPVRIVTRSGRGQAAFQRTADITWLPPTAQNLAKLTVPVPAGFRRVPLAQAVKPILRPTSRSLLRPIPSGQSPEPTVLCRPAPTDVACGPRTGDTSGSGPRRAAGIPVRPRQSAAATATGPSEARPG